jgi:hypothetical protein
VKCFRKPETQNGNFGEYLTVKGIWCRRFPPTFDQEGHVIRIALFLLGLSSLGAGAVAQTPSREANARVHVRSLTVISKDLPEPERLQVAHAFKDCTCPLLEISSRIKWKLYDLGYGQATAEIPHLADLLAAPPAGPVDISVLVTAGPKYRIDIIVVKGAIAFPRDEIMSQLQVAPGDLFNATAIIKGLDNIRKLYAGKGYMNFVAIPTLQYDGTQHTVVLTIDIDEGQPSSSGSNSAIRPRKVWFSANCSARPATRLDTQLVVDSRPPRARG